MPPQGNNNEEPQSQGVFSDFLDGKYASSDAMYAVYGAVGIVSPAGAAVDGIAHTAEAFVFVYGGAAEYFLSDEKDLERFEERVETSKDHLKSAVKDVFWLIPGLKLLSRLRKIAKLLKLFIKAEKLLKALSKMQRTTKTFKKINEYSNRCNNVSMRMTKCIKKQFNGMGKELAEVMKDKNTILSFSEKLEKWQKTKKISLTEAGEMLNTIASWIDAIIGVAQSIAAVVDDLERPLETRDEKEFREIMEELEKLNRELERLQNTDFMWEEIEETWNEPEASKKRIESEGIIKKHNEEMEKFVGISAKASSEGIAAETEEKTAIANAKRCQSEIEAYETGLNGARSSGDKQLEKILIENRNNAFKEYCDWMDKADKAAEKRETAENKVYDAKLQIAWLKYDIAQQEANIAKNTKPDRFAALQFHGYEGKQNLANDYMADYDKLKEKIEGWNQEQKNEQTKRKIEKQKREAEKKKMKIK